MYTVAEFADFYRQKETPNFLKLFIRDYGLGPGYDKPEDLDMKQFRIYDHFKNSYYEDSIINWRRYLSI